MKDQPWYLDKSREANIVCSQYNIFVFFCSVILERRCFCPLHTIFKPAAVRLNKHTQLILVHQTSIAKVWNHCVFETMLFEHNQTSTCVARPIGGRVTLLVSTAGPENRFQDGTADHLTYFPERLDQIPRGLSWCGLRRQMSPSCSGWHVIGQTGVITHQRLKAGAGVLQIVNKDLTDVESAGRRLAGRQIYILSKQ